MCSLFPWEGLALTKYWFMFGGDRLMDCGVV